MTVFSFHLAQTGVLAGSRALLMPPGDVPGLRRAECMAMMELGSPLFSPRRVRPQHLVVFAAWEHEDAIDDYLTKTALGQHLQHGWHVRLEFVRRWGRISEFDGLPATVGELDPDGPVVAVTLARLKLPQVPRFVRWGKPVERQVRDHPGSTFSLAAMRPPRTVSTFSVWRSLTAMTDMVRGRSGGAEADRHAVAMVERERKDFHHEFTTLRFRCLSEHGEWEGRSNIVPR